MATTAPPRTAKPAAIAETERCCGCSCGKQECAHCNLTCFERPDYHCGHLLTDADLSLQVQYFVEKNKLRNRTLHGRGVVCGLKLTCAPDCCGHILVHEGYAIDACGNDIVVCETEAFDVIGALKAAHLIVPAEERDPCQKDSTETPCNVPQCFYVTIRYAEEPSDYLTPFQATCTGGPQECVPTRIKERFELAVSDVPPEETSFLAEFEARLKRCFRLFIDSPVGRLITKYMDQLQQIATGENSDATGNDGITPCDLFCLLKAQFQAFMRQSPDMLSCSLAREVAALECPKGGAQGGQIKAVFIALLEAMSRYQYDCVMASLVFDCAAPKTGGAVLLGCVEVDERCVLRVNNSARRYVWSFANILQVMMATVIADRSNSSKVDTDQDTRVHAKTDCCDDSFNFDLDAFLAEFTASPAGRYYAAVAPMRAFSAVRAAFGDSFDFTDSKAIAPELFAKLDSKSAVALAQRFGIGATLSDSQDEPAVRNPLEAMLAHSMVRSDSAMRMFKDGSDTLRVVVPEPTTASDSATDKQTIAELQRSLSALHERVAKLEPVVAPPPTPSAPPPPAGATAGSSSSPDKTTRPKVPDTPAPKGPDTPAAKVPDTPAAGTGDAAPTPKPKESK